MAPFLPNGLYQTGLPLAALATQQREAAVVPSVAESSLAQRSGVLMGNMVPAPAEKKITMYSRVRGLMQRA